MMLINIAVIAFLIVLVIPLDLSREYLLLDLLLQVLLRRNIKHSNWRILRRIMKRTIANRL